MWCVVCGVWGVGCRVQCIRCRVGRIPDEEEEGGERRAQRVRVVRQEQRVACGAGKHVHEEHVGRVGFGPR